MTTLESTQRRNQMHSQPITTMLPSKGVLRDRISRIIGATRFPFIDQTIWDENRRTIVNASNEKNYAFAGPKGKVYPSVVVLNPDGAIREIGEVEMDVGPGLVEKWRLLSESTGMGERFKKLFVYVPAGEGERALVLLEDNCIQYAGLREWSIEDGMLVTRPVKTPDMDYDHRVS
jgi:hypothetical protein